MSITLKIDIICNDAIVELMADGSPTVEHLQMLHALNDAQQQLISKILSNDHDINSISRTEEGENE